MFNKIESYIIDLLQNRIFYNDKPVQIYAKFMDAPQTPCMTLDMNTRVTTESVRRIIDTTEKVYYYRNGTIDLNVWTDTPQMRENIINQIMTIFYDAQNDNYQFCTNYDKNTQQCYTTQTTCAAINDNCLRALKNLCPDPEALNYENIATRHGLIHGGVNIEPPYYILDNSDTPPLYRAVLKVDAEYIDIANAGGQPTEELNNNIKII